MLVLAVERVVRLLGVERLFHVKHMFMGMVSVLVVASRSEVSDDSMNRRCLSMRFYDAKMGFNEL